MIIRLLFIHRFYEQSPPVKNYAVISFKNNLKYWENWAVYNQHLTCWTTKNEIHIKHKILEDYFNKLQNVKLPKSFYFFN